MKQKGFCVKNVVTFCDPLQKVENDFLKYDSEISLIFEAHLPFFWFILLNKGMIVPLIVPFCFKKEAYLLRIYLLCTFLDMSCKLVPDLPQILTDLGGFFGLVTFVAILSFVF